jgi:myo-inositol-1(or 4)-monophosphatase
VTRRPAAHSAKLHLELAHALADQSAKAILPHFRKAIPVDNKAVGRDFDPVTQADEAAERAIVRILSKRCPDHGIIGEEFGTVRPDARFQWVIDPIDGTRGFIMGTPMWGTLIGLLEDGDPILGIMNQPYTGERFWTDGVTSFFKGPSGRAKRLATRPCKRMGDALVMTTNPELFAKGAEMEAFVRVRSETRMTRYGGDCYAYCMLASGFVDVIVETGLKTYDVAALIPIVEKAGGRFTSWDGGPATDGGQIVASGDPALHERVLKLLNR